MPLTLLGLPLIYIAALCVAAWRGHARSAATSLILAVVVAAAGAWSISVSRSSTAGIGFLFLPMLASIAGLCALAFVLSRRTTSIPMRTAGWLALAAYVGALAAPATGARRTVALNSQRDSSYAEQTRAIERHRAEIEAAMPAKNPDSTRVDQMVREHPNDRAFVIGALETHLVSAAMLDTLSRSSDDGIVMEAVRQVNALPATVARVYTSNPDYFAAAVAAHAHAPPEVLNDLARRISNPYVLRELVSNPALQDSTRRRLLAARTDLK
jgi:hypothetical protein